VASRTMRRPCRRVELHHLPTGQVIRWEHTDESLGRQLERVHDIASEAAHAVQQVPVGPAREPLATVDLDAVFPPRPGALCGWCDFRAHCPQGQAASPRRTLPWAGLPADISSTVDDLVD
jgi:hypothetical protein